MSLSEKSVAEFNFTKEDIQRQVNRIFLDPSFRKSDILRHFLSYIVDETIRGHSEWVKEYTIAVNVLHKPANFNPQENCIVRIHAGRLRRALNRYYNEQGALDPLRISIPKGSYVPVFHESSKTIAEVVNADDRIPGKPDIVAVIPFNHVHSNASENSLADGLGFQLSSAFAHTRYFSVIAYYIIRDMYESRGDIGKITQSTDAKYIITGDIQSIGNRLRIFVQLIHTPTNKQVWSQKYDKKLTAENIFEIQDEIVGLIVPELEEVFNPKKNELQRELMAAIA